MLVRICPALLLCVSLLSTQVLANDALTQENWVELGSATARVSENNLTIYPKTEESFSKLRFHISHGAAILHQARVYLVKGDVFHVNLQKTLKSSKNGEDGEDYSQTVPLITSQQSPIEKVMVFYKFKQRQNPSKQVSLELLGVPAE
ncbi:hypothetical protein [Endozoicomonas sp.]|uniref:hypothetical protein n=1 Tax=Endozoicomonas sp. TaxID=1892382 RepID=UPI002887744A|nr:hypothetical protein [Endozoicomonas sp.]